MALRRTIPELPAADALTEDDFALVSQGGKARRATVRQIAELVDINGELVSAVAVAEGHVAAAEAAALNAQASALTCESWSVLSGLTGSAVGIGAEVLDIDTATHTDPVVGGTVPNSGRYRWSASPAGWRRIGDTGLSGKASAGLMPLFEPYISPNLCVPNTVSALPVGARAPANYNPDGSHSTTLAYFGVTGIIAGLTIGETYTINISAAPSSVKFSRSQGGFFWTGSNAFSSRVDHNGTTMAFSTGDRSVTFVAVTSRVSFNLVRSPSSDAMSPIFADVLAALMLNEGATGLPYEPPVPEYPYRPGVLFDAPAYSDADDVKVQVAGDGYVYARTRWGADTDKCQRFRWGVAPSTSGNNLWDHYGERLISSSTPLAATSTAYDSSSTILRWAVEETPPFQLNGMWLGGNHGPLCRELTIAGHGYVAADLGSVWSDGVRNRVLVQIIDANKVRFIENYSGTVTSWAVGWNAVSGTTLTWVSGGVARGTKTLTVDTATQAWPYLRSRVGAITLDGADISATGVYSGSNLRFSERYDVPNLARALDYMKAHSGDLDNSLTHTSIGAHIQFSMSHTLDWTGVVRTVWTALDVESYTPGQYGGSQVQAPTMPAGGSLTVYIPRTLPFSGYDFEAGQSVTSWAVSESILKTTAWSDATDPPTTVVMLAKDSAGAPKWAIYYALDDTAGQAKPETRSDLSSAMLLSSMKKMYLIAGGAGSTAGAGQAHETISYVGTVNPATTPDLTWCITYPKAGRYALSARAPGALTARWVPVDGRLLGLPVSLVRGGDYAALLSTTVQDQGALVTWTAAGEIEVAIG